MGSESKGPTPRRLIKSIFIMRSARPRVKIRAPKKAPAVDLSTVWAERLEPALQQIYHRGETPLSFEALYDSVYRLVQQQHAKALYKRFGEHSRSYLVSEVAPVALKAANGSDDLIRTVAGLWQEYMLSLRMVADVFMYLNRAYCAESTSPRVEHLGETMFRDEVLRARVEGTLASSRCLQDVLFNCILLAIDRERQGDAIDKAAIKTVVEMLAELPNDHQGAGSSIYVELLEDRILEATAAYYTANFEQTMENLPPASEVLEEISKWEQSERMRGELYLPSETTGRILETLRQKVVAQALPRVFALPTGISEWLVTDAVQPLTLAAQLEVAADIKPSALIGLASNALRDQQLAINKQAVDAAAHGDAKALVNIAFEWVDNSIKLHKRFQGNAETLVAAGLPTVGRELLAVWVKTINDLDETAAAIKGVSTADFLATFLNEHLKKATSTPDNDIETALSETVTLYEALVEKDRFISSYKHHLARRLLNSRSQSDDLEALFVTRLRRVAGPQQVSQFENMFRDMQMSKELNNNFKQLKPPVATHVNVVKTFFWPQAVTTEKTIVLPPVLDTAKREFEDFYVSQHNSRKLRWNLGIGSAEMLLRAPSGNYQVSLSLSALAVMMLFPDEQELTASEIQERTQIPTEELSRVLQPLCFAPRAQLLVKTPADRQVLATDKFKFNMAFKSPTPRVKVMTVASAARADAARQQKEVSEDVARARAAQIEAAIVRVMKARKELGHTLLVEEVARQLVRYFRASPTLIKRQIGRLIDTEYIARSDKDPSVYIYLA